MKFVFFFLVALHGLIHLLGFVKAFDLADVSQFAQNISRLLGVMWLVAGVLFILSGILFLSGEEHWCWPAASAILISQTLIFLSWRDARFGTVANIAILLPLIVAFANALPSSFVNRYHAELQRGLARSVEMPLLREDDIRHLPAPVQKYVRFVGAIGKPRIWNFRARFTGQIRRSNEGRWLEFSSRYCSALSTPGAT